MFLALGSGHKSKPKRALGLSEKLVAQEKEMIEAALLDSGGRVSGPGGAAARLGMPGLTWIRRSSR
jgi:formate hydrogenlyase transcriptional activator